VGASTSLAFLARFLAAPRRRPRAPTSVRPSRFPVVGILGVRCSSPIRGVSPAPYSARSRSAAPCGVSVQEPVSESTDVERSLCSKVMLMCFISVPRARWNYTVHQVEPHYLVSLHYSGRSPGIPEGAVCDRLTHYHLSHGHGTHTIGLGIVFQGLIL